MLFYSRFGHRFQLMFELLRPKTSNDFLTVRCILGFRSMSCTEPHIRIKKQKSGNCLNSSFPQPYNGSPLAGVPLVTLKLVFPFISLKLYRRIFHEAKHQTLMLPVEHQLREHPLQSIEILLIHY